MATKQTRRWSAQVTEKSDALDLEEEVFTRDDPRSIARSLKRSAERSNWSSSAGKRASNWNGSPPRCS